MPSTLFNSSFSLPGLDTQQWPAPMLETVCPADRPLALLPIRLETRFVTPPGGARELRIRVYPDKLHLDAHERELTGAEAEWGRHFWEQDWRAGDDSEARARAWRQLAERFGDARAAWIARQLRPLNAQSRPTHPTAATDALAVAPQFPSAAVTAAGDSESWRHAPVARLMPERWIAILQSRGRPMLTATSAKIAQPLQVGPDPKAPPPVNVAPGEVPIPEGMKWMLDFEAAEAAGMAMRLPVSADVLAQGIDSLIVIGLPNAVSPEDITRQWQELVDAHHYTDGFEFLPVGTPTNNTADERTLYRSDGDHERSLSSEITRDAAGLSADSNARQIGSATGLSSTDAIDVFGRVAGADAAHDRDGFAMNAALWQTGWGYFLVNMIGAENTGLSFDDVAWAREHFTRYVRAFGPFAPIRCGRQPYGILPVTSLDLWTPAAADAASAARDRWLQAFLLKLRDQIWRPHLPDVSRIGRRQNPPDPDADLAEVMRTDASSMGFKARALLGRHYLQHLRALVGEDLQATGFVAAQDALTGAIVDRLGFPWRPRLARGTYGDMAWRVSAPLVQPGEVSHQRRLDPDFIAALLAEPTIAGLGTSPAHEPTSLLHALLRHALRREYAQAAALIVGPATGADPLRLLRDAELIDLVPGAPEGPTWGAQLDTVVAPVTGTKTVRQHLEGLTKFTDPAVASLGEWRSSAEHLRGRDSETLLALMQGTLDLASHRLDAWITSFATRRLAAMRAATPQGIRAGAYGWVENLQPSGVATTAVDPPPGESGPLVAFADDSGFIHAPSFTHAATGALLRNAHLGSGTVGQPNQPYAIDLSSRRARDAAWLLDAMRQGQPLGAVLGYRLERRLHELGLHVLVATLRNLNPLSARKLEPSDLPLETIAANNVVDGAALFERLQTAESSVTTALQQAGASAAQSNRVIGEIRELGDAIDAVSDALMAETAYQMVRGNTARTASTLKAIAVGEAPPPELEVVRTPRTGTAINHRVVALLPGVPIETTGWPAATASVRAASDPVLNAWAANLLGDPTKVQCRVERRNDAGDTVLETRIFPLSAVGLTALDVVYAVAVPGDARSDARSALEERVLYHARRGSGGMGDAARLQVVLSRTTDLQPADVALVDVVAQASAVRALLASARAIDPDDLQPPERASGGTLDIEDLASRVHDAEQALQRSRDVLAALLEDGTAATSASLQDALVQLAAFGFNAAIPAVSVDDDLATRVLRQQADVLIKDVSARVDTVRKLQAAAADPDPRRKRDQLIARLRAVFGSTGAVSVRFRHEPAAALELSQALAASTDLQAEDPLALYTWFLRSTRVRDSLARLAQVLRVAEVQGLAERLALRVAQLPHETNGRWVGLPPVSGADLPHGKLSLVVQSVRPIDTATSLSGLWIDEWIEVVPNRRETTAVTFQYNAPDACAPQSVLFAVPPDPEKPWTVATLYRVLVETLDVAKLRAVPLEALQELAHYLPASFLALNAAGDTVSTDVTPLIR